MDDVRITVDTGALARAARAVERQNEALGLVRRHLAEVADGVGAWAADQPLAWSAPRCLATIRWQGDRLARELSALSERLGRAGADYALTERTARAALERDSPGTS
jgi:hypothetical protein